MRDANIGTKIAIRITGGYVKFPKDPQQTVICIGPGTGIAPFRSLIQDRSSSGLRSESPSDLVIFGCRSQSKDFYYSLEWARFVDDRVCKFLCAGSRDQVLKFSLLFPHPSFIIRVFFQSSLHFLPSLVAIEIPSSLFVLC